MSILINQIIKSLLILMFFIGINSFSNEKPKKHKIQKGETITSISKKYNVTIAAIYELNPESKNVLKLNSILKIPSSKKSKFGKIENEIQLDLVHQVAPKETLYRISKLYKISIENIKKWNPILVNSSLEIGQIINVAENKLVVKQESKENKTSEIASHENIIHEVLPKETLYSLSKKYKTTIQKLEELNPEIKNGLPVGYKLIVNQSNNNLVNLPKIETQKTEIKTDSIKIIPKIESKQLIIEDSAIVKDSTLVAKPITNIELASSLEQRASEQIGSRYRTGGTKPGAFDCSGLMIYIFENSGLKLPRTSAEQSRFGGRINKEDAQKGDLIFFATNGRSYVNHVGMVVENNGGEIKFIHSSSHGGVIISSVADNYYQRAFKHINRVLE